MYKQNQRLAESDQARLPYGIIDLDDDLSSDDEA